MIKARATAKWFAKGLRPTFRYGTAKDGAPSFLSLEKKDKD